MTESYDGTCGQTLAQDAPAQSSKLRTVKAARLAENPATNASDPIYEIRICNSRHQASLILAAECRNDVAAIFMARNFIRRGEGAEVWRDDTLVYRLEPRVTGKAVRPAKPTQQPVSNLNLQWWIQCLVNAIAIRSPNNWLNP